MRADAAIFRTDMVIPFVGLQNGQVEEIAI